jgi:hypothetical protein
MILHLTNGSEGDAIIHGILGDETVWDLSRRPEFPWVIRPKDGMSINE